jgi:hypothetical protein
MAQNKCPIFPCQHFYFQSDQFYRFQNGCGDQQCQVGEANLQQNPLVFPHLFGTFVQNQPNEEGIEEEAQAEAHQIDPLKQLTNYDGHLLCDCAKYGKV